MIVEIRRATPAGRMLGVLSERLSGPVDNRVVDKPAALWITLGISAKAQVKPGG